MASATRPYHHTPAPTPSRAVYGFAMYLSLKVLFILYVLWALIPEEIFLKYGIDFFPRQHWAISIPCFILTVLTVFAFVIYPSLGLLMTPDIEDVRTVMDNVAKYGRKEYEVNIDPNQKPNKRCICKYPSQCWEYLYDDAYEKKAKENQIPKINDLNMWDVSEHLYLKHE